SATAPRVYPTDTVTHREDTQTQTPQTPERSAKSTPRWHAANASTDFATETRRHREERRTQRPQSPQRSAQSPPRCHAAIASTDFATETRRHGGPERTLPDAQRVARRPAQPACCPGRRRTQTQ